VKYKQLPEIYHSILQGGTNEKFTFIEYPFNPFSLHFNPFSLHCSLNGTDDTLGSMDISSTKPDGGNNW